MRIEPPARMLVIFIDETDTWGESRVPLAEAIVQVLFDHHIDGATVLNGVMGFGANRRVHKKSLFGVTDEKPVTILAVESEAKLRAVLPKLREMVSEGVMFLLAGDVIA